MPSERVTRLQQRGFSGSYASEDVTFLLKPVTLAPTTIVEKERQIQAGRHYSEMIAPEAPPSSAYLALYEEALARNGGRLAADVSTLAARIAESRTGREVVIASLARAGTPIGVLLNRVLRARGIAANHYSISIIRGRGIDMAALAYLAERHDPADVIFVDGWTGKGAIADELERALVDRPLGFRARLAVIADPAGRATLAASHDDYLIASGLLNAVVSGLVSRSILSAETVGPGDFHACVRYDEWSHLDSSRSFVDGIAPLAVAAQPVQPLAAGAKLSAAASCEETILSVVERTGVQDRHRIKPGIAEATRALLRRVPERLFVRDFGDPDVRHLLHLARAANVEVEQLSSGSTYRALALIARVGDD
jgi:hypothetical protein